MTSLKRSVISEWLHGRTANHQRHRSSSASDGDWPVRSNESCTYVSNVTLTFCSSYPVNCFISTDSHTLDIAQQIPHEFIESHINSDKSSIEDYILCYYTNAQGIVSKFDELKNNLIDVVKANIIGITESWCYKDISDNKIYIDGFTTYRKDRDVIEGVFLYISYELTSMPCISLNNTSMTVFFISLTSDHKKTVDLLLNFTSVFTQENMNTMPELLTQIISTRMYDMVITRKMYVKYYKAYKRAKQ